MVKEKTCTKCSVTKPETDFYTWSKNKKVRPECKKCTSKTNVSYRRKLQQLPDTDLHKQQRREYSREYYHKNKEKFLTYRAQFLETHPDYFKKYYLDIKHK